MNTSKEAIAAVDKLFRILHDLSTGLPVFRNQVAPIIQSAIDAALAALDDKWRDRFRKFEKIENKFGPALQRSEPDGKRDLEAEREKFLQMDAAHVTAEQVLAAEVIAERKRHKDAEGILFMALAAEREKAKRLVEALRKIINTPLGHQEIHDCAAAALAEAEKEGK
jgi:hypothetical protein